MLASSIAPALETLVAVGVGNLTVEALTLLAGACALSLLPAGAPGLGERTELAGTLAATYVLTLLLARAAFLIGGPTLGPWLMVVGAPIALAVALRWLGPRAMRPGRPLPPDPPPASRDGRLLAWALALAVAVGAAAPIWLDGGRHGVWPLLRPLAIAGAVAFALRCGGTGAIGRRLASLAIVLLVVFGDSALRSALHENGMTLGSDARGAITMALNLIPAIAFAWVFLRRADRRCLALAVAWTVWAPLGSWLLPSVQLAVGAAGLLALVAAAPAALRRRAATSAAVGAALFTALWFGAAAA